MPGNTLRKVTWKRNVTWEVNANGYHGSLRTSVDGSGNVSGTIFGDKIAGFWDEDAKKITFVRIQQSAAVDAYQFYTGYWFEEKLDENKFRHTLAGPFVAFRGTGGTAQRSLYGWLAEVEID